MLKILVGISACLAVGACVTNNLTSTPTVQQGVHTQQATAALQGNQLPASTPAPRVASANLAAAKLVIVNKVALNNEQLILGSFQSLSPDCEAQGHVAIKVIAEPAHGRIQIVDGSAFSGYAAGDPHVRCNSLKTPATLAYYRSEAGFAGLDTAVIEVFFPTGNAPTLRYAITVK